MAGIGDILIARRLADVLTPDVGDEDDENSLLSWSVHNFPNSSAILVVKHRLRDGAMTVRFNKPGKAYPDYLYNDVPRELFRQWKRVKSAGGFYHRRIKGQYGVF